MLEIPFQHALLNFEEPENKLTLWKHPFSPSVFHYLIDNAHMQMFSIRLGREFCHWV